MTTATSMERPTAEFPNAATKARKSRSKAVPVATLPNPVDPVLKAFHRLWVIDAIGCPDGLRARVQAHSASLDGTNRGEALSERRAWMAADWLVRTVAPIWLEFSTEPVANLAAKLRALPRITSDDSLTAAQPLLQAGMDALLGAVNTAGLDQTLSEAEIGDAESMTRASVVNLLGEQALYAAANVSRGPGAFVTADDFGVAEEEEFHPAVQLVMDLAMDTAMVEVVGLVAGCIQNGSRSGEVDIDKAIERGCRIVLADVHTCLVASAEKLLEQMLAGEGYDQPPEVPSTNGGGIPSDLLGQHSAPEISQARDWMAIDWIARSALPDLIGQVPELGGHAVWLSSLNTIHDVAGLQRAHAGMQRIKRDAYALLNSVTSPWLSDDDFDGLDFVSNGPLSTGFYELICASMKACGVGLLASEFRRRSNELDKTLDLYPWEKGLVNLQVGLTDEVDSILCAALHVVMIRALVLPDGSLPDRVDPFGPAGMALLTVENEVRENYFHLHSKLRALGA